jgi:hypothetical protein
MTTIQNTRAHGKTALPLMLLLSASIAAITLVAVTPQVPRHALDSHGADAIRAHEAVADLGFGG